MTFKFCSVCVFLLLLYHAPFLNAKKKIVKLIVPQKVKYIHHTHVLLVRPSYSKKSPLIREEIIEEIPYREEILPSRSRSKIRYVLPSYAESKKISYSRLPPDDLETSYVPSYLDPYHRGIPHETRLPHRNEVEIEEVMEDSRDGWTKPQIYSPSYRMPSLQEKPPAMSASDEYHTISSANGNDYTRDSYQQLDTSYSPMESYDMVAPYNSMDVPTYTNSPIQDWSSSTYAYPSMDLESDKNWSPSKISYEKEQVYRIPYKGHLESGAKVYKLNKGGNADEGQGRGSYVYSGDDRSYYRGKTDSYGRMLLSPTSYDM